MGSIIRRLEHHIFQFISWLAQLLLWVAVAAGFYQVLSRFVLQSPAAWSEALTRSSIIWVVMLGIALAFREGSMLGVDALRNKLSEYGYGRILEHLVLLIVAAFLIFLLWIGINMTWRVRFQTMPTLGVSISWVYASIPTGAALSLLAVFSHWGRNFLHKE